MRSLWMRCARTSLALVLLSGCGSPSDPSAEADAESEAGSDSAAEETGVPLDPPTWYQDLAPVVHEHCGGCHRDGGIAPFSLDSYETAVTWSEVMLAAVESGDMPPFGADDTEICDVPYDFKDDPRLSDEEETLLRDWIAGGTLEGDPDNPAELPELAPTTLEDPDLTLTIPSAVEVSGDKDRFVCFVVDPEVSGLTFMEATQVNPGNDAIVHHVLVYSTSSSQVDEMAGEDGYYDCFGGIGVNNLSLISAWAPGVQPARFPTEAPGVLQGGEKLVINVHYHPTGVGTEIDDSTSIDIKWHEGLPEYVSQLNLIGNFSTGYSGLMPGPNDTDDVPEFRIPAGEESHTEMMRWTKPASLPDLRVWMVGAHMHYVGVDMAIAVQRGADSEHEDFCALQTPNYDFNWQRGYVYDLDFEDTPVLETGDTLYMQCEYNNSFSNPYIADALADQGLDEPIDVHLGEETLDEMCLGVFGIAAPLADFLP